MEIIILLLFQTYLFSFVPLNILQGQEGRAV